MLNTSIKCMSALSLKQLIELGLNSSDVGGLDPKKWELFPFEKVLTI